MRITTRTLTHSQTTISYSESTVADDILIRGLLSATSARLPPDLPTPGPITPADPFPPPQRVSDRFPLPTRRSRSRPAPPTPDRLPPGYAALLSRLSRSRTSRKV